ncbi:hypothetical protein Bca101_059410 [Brassica carinata]
MAIRAYIKFPASFVGGNARPSCLPADPFSFPIPAWAEVPEADREVVPMAPLKHPRSYLLDSGPRSEIWEEGLMEIWRKYGISPSVGMRCSSEYERVPDGGDNEVAIFEAYLEAGFRGIISSLVAVVSSYFGFCHSQLTPLTWRTLMAIQVLGEFHGFSIGVHEVLGNYPFGDDWGKRYVFAKIPGLFSYPTFWRTVDVSLPASFSGEAEVKLAIEIPLCFLGVAFLTSKEALCHSHVWGNVVRLSVSAVYDEYQKGKTRKRRPFYVPPPWLARTAPRAASFSSSSPGDAEAAPNQDLEVRVHRWLVGEVLFLRTQVRDMVAQRDLLIQQVKGFSRWKLMREWMEKRIGHWDAAEEYCRYMLLFGVNLLLLSRLLSEGGLFYGLEALGQRVLSGSAFGLTCRYSKSAAKTLGVDPG